LVGARPRVLVGEGRVALVDLVMNNLEDNQLFGFSLSVTALDKPHLLVHFAGGGSDAKSRSTHYFPRGHWRCCP
jgi:hypothetical protein